MKNIFFSFLILIIIQPLVGISPAYGSNDLQTPDDWRQHAYNLLQNKGSQGVVALKTLEDEQAKIDQAKADRMANEVTPYKQRIQRYIDTMDTSFSASPTDEIQSAKSRNAQAKKIAEDEFRKTYPQDANRRLFNARNPSAVNAMFNQAEQAEIAQSVPKSPSLDLLIPRRIRYSMQNKRVAIYNAITAKYDNLRQVETKEMEADAKFLDSHEAFAEARLGKEPISIVTPLGTMCDTLTKTIKQNIDDIEAEYKEKSIRNWKTADIVVTQLGHGYVKTPAIARGKTRHSTRQVTLKPAVGHTEVAGEVKPRTMQ